MNPEVSVVIPVFNEEAGLPLLFERLFPALDALGRQYEVIFVDDGSHDRSVELLRAVVKARPENARALILAQNAGQHLAILAAFERTRGAVVVTLDADLQNPPECIAAVLAAMDQGADYVGTIRELRQDSWWRTRASRWLNHVRERTTRIRMTDQGCMLRGYDRRIVEEMTRSREVTPFVPALAYTFARKPVEIVVQHEQRAAGESKYSFLRLIRLNFDLMTGYSRVPLQIFSWSGIIIALASRHRLPAHYATAASVGAQSLAMAGGVKNQTALSIIGAVAGAAAGASTLTGFVKQLAGSGISMGLAAAEGNSIPRAPPRRLCPAARA